VDARRGGASVSTRKVMTIVATEEFSLAGTIARRLASLGSESILAFTPQQLSSSAEQMPALDAVIIESAFLESCANDVVDALRSISASPLVIIMDAESLMGTHTLEAVVRSASGRDRLVSDLPLAWGPLTLHPRTHRAWIAGQDLELTPIEFRILASLVAAGGGLVLKEELERDVWGTPPVDDGERLATHVRRIRRKVEDDPHDPDLVLTVRGLGYRLGLAETTLEPWTSRVVGDSSGS
jgi:DNA-binding winged helix-turn-helix (wHTH) protein